VRNQKQGLLWECTGRVRSLVLRASERDCAGDGVDSCTFHFRGFIGASHAFTPPTEDHLF
jgi:hypothetical protein